MAWFEPAWAQLSEDEQYVLESAYVDEIPYLNICAHLNTEKDAYYKRKSRALAHLTTLLYGVI
jgi:DNA-directed RNA polymerase specialized sigma24 family protein